MNTQLLIAIINLVSEVGLSVAVTILQGLGKAATLDDAIAALQASLQKTAADYLKEAQDAVAAQQPPVTPPVTSPVTPPAP